MLIATQKEDKKDSSLRAIFLFFYKFKVKKMK